MNESFLESNYDILSIFAKQDFDSTLQKAAIRMKIKHPTIVQHKLFDIFGVRKHLLIRSKSVTGKSTGCIFLLAHTLINAIKNGEEDDRHTGVILCPNKSVCNANESLCKSILEFAKEEYDINILNLSHINFDVFKNEMYLDSKKRLILIGTPGLYKKFLSYLLNLESFHKSICTIYIDEMNYMLSFGYHDDLKLLFKFYESRSESINLIFTLSQEDNRLKELKNQIMKNRVTIKFDDEKFDTNQMDNDTHDDVTKAINEFFYISDEMNKYIVLYIIFKMKLIAGKTLIVCNDIDEAYKVNAFLERSQIKVSKIYNHEWPANVRNYILSTFMSNITNILVTTNKIFDDDKDRNHLKYKKNLRDVHNIIGFHIHSLIDHYHLLSKFLTKKNIIPCLILMLNINDDSKEILFNLMAQQKKQTNQVDIKELPIKTEDIESFRYRCTDVLHGISKKQINAIKALDLKKQLIKSKSLKEYFDEHKEERNMIVKDINSISQRVSHYAIKMENSLPDYLIADKIKSGKGDVEGGEEEEDNGEKFVKIQRLKTNEEYEKSLRKRMANNNMTMEDIKKKLKVSNDDYIVINQEKEDPLETDASRLPILSSRKLWKLKHKKPLKKVNKRLMKKGIFE